MAAAKRVRWECPNGEHPGVLGSTRPPADAIVRFCLPCSEQAGRLVARVAPALERKRSASRAASERKQAAKRERQRQAERAKRVLTVRELDGSTGELDIPKTLERMIRLPVLRDHAERECPYRKLQAPKVTLRRSRVKGHSSGHAPYYSWRFVVTAGVVPDRIEFEELLLHELIHLLLPDEHHSMRYRSLLSAAAREWWPGIQTRVEGHTAYGLDCAIVLDAIRVARERSAAA